MKELFSKASTKLPKIDFSKKTGILLISGRCIPENSIVFFEPLKKWIEEYVQFPSDKTVLDIFFDYFNTNSSKNLFELIKTIESIHLAGKTKAKVLWKYEKDDEDMLEAGEVYASILDIPFEFIELS